jgi:predicted nucleic acid-binding protein
MTYSNNFAPFNDFAFAFMTDKNILFVRVLSCTTKIRLQCKPNFIENVEINAPTKYIFSSVIKAKAKSLNGAKLFE